MNVKNSLLILTLILITFNSRAQKYIEYVNDEEVLSLSIMDQKVIKLKNSDRINSVRLPDFTSDSLYWERNIGYMIPKSGIRNLVYTRATGIAIDTTINFFEVATRVRIKEGYVWIYKAYSPTAISVGAMIDSISLRRDQYICMYSTYIDSTGIIPYNYDLQYRHAPDIYTLEDSEDSIFHFAKFGAGFSDQTLYIEVFSPEKSIEKSCVNIVSLSHGWPYAYELSEAPDWIRERYPEVDFD